MAQVSGHKVGEIGFGMMGMSWRQSPQPADQSMKTMKAAIDEGATFWDGGENYGTPEFNSLHLINRYFTERPQDADKVVICIKGGMKVGVTDIKDMGPDGTAKGTARSIDECLRILDGKKHLDFWEMARVDDKVPIEVMVREAKRYVDAGKMTGYFLSECSANTIRRAAKVFKPAGVEVEFSLYSTDILHNGVAQACAELDIPIVAYSPLSRGFLTGRFRKHSDIPADSSLHHFPRFSKENFDTNVKLLHEVETIAKRRNVTPPQIALGWIMAKSGTDGRPTIIPIPGATTVERVHENMKPIHLDAQEVKEIDSILDKIPVVGERYALLAHLCWGDTPEEK